MSLERFSEIVEAAKQQELEIEELIKKVDKEMRLRIKVEKQLDLMGREVVELRDTEIIKRMPNRDGPRVHGEHVRAGISKDIVGVTERVDSDGFIAQINYINPETGKPTTKQAKRATLIEAIIARNEIAASLIRKGIIDFEKFKRMTSL